MASTLIDGVCRGCGGSTGTTVDDHEAKADPHPQYLTQTEGDALYAGGGDAAAAVAAHVALGDPHAQYLLETAAAATYATPGDITTAVSAHEAAGDPHPDYATETFTEDRTGWAYYQDDTVTSGSPLTLVAATPTNLPNAADTLNESELPSDATELYDGTVVTFRTLGELLEVQVEVTVEAVAATDWLDIWLEDSGANRFAQHVMALPKGTTAQRLTHRFAVQANAALVASGGTVRVESNDAVDLYDIRYRISRGHQFRTT